MNTMVAWGLHEVLSWIIILLLVAKFYPKKKENK